MSDEALDAAGDGSQSSTGQGSGASGFGDFDRFDVGVVVSRDINAHYVEEDHYLWIRDPDDPDGDEIKEWVKDTGPIHTYSLVVTGTDDRVIHHYGNDEIGPYGFTVASNGTIVPDIRTSHTDIGAATNPSGFVGKAQTFIGDNSKAGRIPDIGAPGDGTGDVDDSNSNYQPPNNSGGGQQEGGEGSQTNTFVNLGDFSAIGRDRTLQQLQDSQNVAPAFKSSQQFSYFQFYASTALFGPGIQSPADWAEFKHYFNPLNYWNGEISNGPGDGFDRFLQHGTRVGQVMFVVGGSGAAIVASGAGTAIATGVVNAVRTVGGAAISGYRWAAGGLNAVGGFATNAFIRGQIAAHNALSYVYAFAGSISVAAATRFQNFGVWLGQRPGLQEFAFEFGLGMAGHDGPGNTVTSSTGRILAEGVEHNGGFWNRMFAMICRSGDDAGRCADDVLGAGPNNAPDYYSLKLTRIWQVRAPVVIPQ